MNRYEITYVDKSNDKSFTTYVKAPNPDTALTELDKLMAGTTGQSIRGFKITRILLANEDKDDGIVGGFK